MKINLMSSLSVLIHLMNFFCGVTKKYLAHNNIMGGISYG